MCAELKTNSQKRNQKIEMECKKIKKTNGRQYEKPK